MTDEQDIVEKLNNLKAIDIVTMSDGQPSMVVQSEKVEEVARLAAKEIIKLRTNLDHLKQLGVKRAAKLEDIREILDDW